MARSPAVQKSYRGPLMLAIALHVLLIVLMVVKVSKKEFRWEESAAASPTIVTATAVDARQLKQHIDAIQQEQTAQQRQRQQQLAKLEQSRQQEQQRLEKLRQQQLALQEAQAKAAQELKQQQAAAKLAEEKSKKIQADLEKQQKEQAKREQQKKEQAKRELAEQQAKLQQALLKEQLQAEAKQLQAQQAAAQRRAAAMNRGVLDQYRAQIMRAIQQQWHPTVQDSHLSCQLLVQIAPGGKVTHVDIVKSSGDVGLDRSAELAILKASPLPVPSDKLLFNEFRELRIKMTPEDIQGLV